MDSQLRWYSDPPVNTAVEAHQLVKRFGATVAVDQLDLMVPRGATWGFIGPSGAGKTTAIRLILSILFPDSGTLAVLGKRSALEAKDRIGYLPEERGSYRKMRVLDFLQYLAELKGVSADTAVKRAQGLLGELGLEAAGKKRCEDLSKGMLQRVQFVGAIINEPELLILDEPFGGLDPVSVRALKRLIAKEQQRGATILFSTHVMAHAEELCDHVVMIHQGRKVLDEPAEKLKRQFDNRRILFEPHDLSASLAPLRALPFIERMEETGQGTQMIFLHEGTSAPEALRQISAAVAPARIEIARLRLEDVFVQLVGAEQSLLSHLRGEEGGDS